MKVSILVPAYNEQSTIVLVLRKLLDVPFSNQFAVDKEILVVDDGSTDQTCQRVEEFLANNPADQDKIRLIRQPKNAGKTAAIAKAMSNATGDVIIVQDADLEYDPNEYSKLLKPLTEVNADVVYGSRFAGSSSRRVHLYWHHVGNKILTTLSNIQTNLNLTDMETCYKVMRTEIAKVIEIKEKRFGIEPEITAKVAAMGLRIYEVPISYNGRSYEEGKKINWKDGFSAIRCILKYNLKHQKQQQKNRFTNWQNENKKTT
jgi:glycosyltransferase involved in cell wall biosynthesis